MDLSKMSSGGLRSLHDAVRRALAEDDALADGCKIYGVREYPEWRHWNDALEDELKRRRESFKPLGWYTGNA
jgi:hypothetical protein